MVVDMAAISYPFLRLTTNTTTAAAEPVALAIVGSLHPFPLAGED
jgi:hypothetical protein